MTKLLLILGLSIVLPCLVLSNPQCHTSELRQCFDIAINWLHTLPKRSLPVKEPQLEVMCTEFDKLYTCLTKYRDSCLTPMQKEVLGLVTEGVANFNSDSCKPGPDRIKYLKHAECLNKISQSDEVRDTIEYILAMVEKLKDIENEKKLVYACCGYVTGLGLFTDMGERDCGIEAVEASKEIASVIFAQGPDVLCNGFTASEERCVAMMPPTGTKPSDALKGTALYDFIRYVLKNWLD